MTNTLKKIIAYDEKRQPKELTQVRLIPGKGIPGDRHYDSHSAPVSLWFLSDDSVSLESWPPERHRKGLCTLKFKANLIVKPSSTSPQQLNLHEGDPLQVGGSVLTVNKKKPCYADCPLVESGESCALKGNVYFTSVAKTGMIGVGDRVKK